MKLRAITFLSALGLVLSMISFASRADTDNLHLLQKFSAQDGVVNFLPGAWVSVKENHRTKYYRFDGKKFSVAAELPELLKGWQSYSGGADYIDQIARQDFDPTIQHLLPKLSKVKKIIDKKIAGQELIYVCYTLPVDDPDIAPSSTDVYLAILKEKPTASGASYQVLETIELEPDAAYGDICIQDIANIGELLVFYWSQPAATGSVDGLDLYKIE